MAHTVPCQPLQSRPPRSERDTKKSTPAPFIPCQLVWLENSSAPPASAPVRWARTQAGAGTLPKAPLQEQPGQRPGKTLWLPGCLSLLHHNQKLAAYTDLLTFSIASGTSREREREKERGAGALCFHICAHDVKWICLIEFMTQREPRGWEVESGGGRIKFAPDFYTQTIGGNAKQPLEKRSGLNGAEWEGVRFAWLPALAGSAPPRAQAEVWVPALGSKPRRLLCIDNGGRSQERGEAQNRGHLALGRAGKRQREIIGA